MQSAQLRRPSAAALAALGTVWCAYRDAALLHGWRRAVRAAVCCTVDSDGPLEWLCFHDAAGRECWRLYQLPDTDLLGWDRIVAALPACPCERPPSPLLSERLWQRMRGRLRETPWQACAIRLHADGHSALARLQVEPAELSAIGAAIATRICRRADLQPGLPRATVPIGTVLTFRPRGTAA